jgi:DNA invertase Pin-like site-specific DNA recombinase
MPDGPGRAAAVQRVGHGDGVESNLIRIREGMKVARAKGRLRGKQPKLKPAQARHLPELHDLGRYSQAELAEIFGVGRSTVHRTMLRLRPRPAEPERPLRSSSEA